MKTIADLLTRARAELGEVEAAMRGAIANQNISDVLASALRKLEQAAQHPDATTELDSLKPQEPSFPFDHKAGA